MSKQAYSKSKGRSAEAAVVDYLRSQGWPAERRRLTGAQDCGDVSGVAGWVIESKAEKRLNLAGYLDELAAEVGNADRRFGPGHRGVVVAKRRGCTDPAEWYAVLPLAAFTALLKSLPVPTDKLA